MIKSITNDDYHAMIDILVFNRQKANITQQQLAKQLDMAQSMISRIERKERRVDMVEFIYICDELGVDPVNLIEQWRAGYGRQRICY